jgi:hypothetical protein
VRWAYYCSRPPRDFCYHCDEGSKVMNAHIYFGMGNTFRGYAEMRVFFVDIFLAES